MTPNAAPRKKTKWEKKNNTKLPLNLIHTVALTPEIIYFSGSQKRTQTETHSRTHFSILTSLPSNVFIKIPPFVTFHLVLPPFDQPTWVVFCVYFSYADYRKYTKCIFRWQVTVLFLFLAFIAGSLYLFSFLLLFAFCSVMKMSKKFHRTWIFTRFNFVPIKCLWIFSFFVVDDEL